MKKKSAPILGIIDRYIFLELIPPFFLGLLICTFILLIGRISKLTELAISKGAGFAVLVQLIVYIIPSFLSLTMPMAVLIASVVTFNRLSSDNEIVVLRACGVSLYRIIFPTFLLAATVYIVTTLMITQVSPLANRSFYKLLYNVAQSKAAFVIEEGVFCNSFPGMVIFANKIPAGNNMSEVFISDERNPEKPHVITARQGTLVNDPSIRGIVLRLQEGTIHNLREEGDIYQKLTFLSNDIVLDFEKPEDGGIKYGKKELLLPELRDAIRKKEAAGDPNSRKEALTYRIELDKKFAFPFAAIVFALLGAPLGITGRRSGKVAGFSTGIAVLILYYVIESAGERLCTQGKLPPLIALWFPNLLFAVAGAYLLYRAANDNTFRLASPVEWLKRFRMPGKRS